MGIGVSIFLIAVGAILYFAVNVTASGLSIATVGLILMAVGALGLVVSLFALAATRRTYYYDSGPPRDTIIHER
jgi:hypothetical protein